MDSGMRFSEMTDEEFLVWLKGTPLTISKTVAAIARIAEMADENDEWDGVYKYRAARAIARFLCPEAHTDETPGDDPRHLWKPFYDTRRCSICFKVAARGNES